MVGMGWQVNVAAISKSYSAFLHRLAYKSHILECVGDSYRVFDETQNIHTVAFTLHVSRRHGVPWEQRLFTVEV